MKSVTRVVLLFLASCAGTSVLLQEAPAQDDPKSFQLFYDVLSPHGLWVDYQQYGYVWIPTGDPGFSPYGTAGHWVLTDEGWTWDSDYSWGWVAFHYGRWDLDKVYGWLWVPHATWGPAWVSWRSAPGYYGWAPIRPGISTRIASGREYREHCDRWIFVQDRDIASFDIERRYVNRRNNVSIMRTSTGIENTRKDHTRNALYITGPTKGDVQWVTRTTVTSGVIREADLPGCRLAEGEFRVYRPFVHPPGAWGVIPAPSKLTRLRDVQSMAERTASRRKQE